jgi:hypothetical protein
MLHQALPRRHLPLLEVDTADEVVTADEVDKVKSKAVLLFTGRAASLAIEPRQG